MSLIATIARKEIRDAIVSPRFLLSFGVTALIMLLAFANGALTYHRQKSQYEAARAANERRFNGVTEWHQVNETESLLPPTTLSAIIPGLSYDIGTRARISPGGEIRTRGSVYGGELFFALFRVLDVEFVCVLLLPLLCIVMAHDAICGERERATLRLLLAHPIPRDSILFGKAIGVLAVLVPGTLLLFLLGILLLLFSGVPISGNDMLPIIGLAATAAIVALFWTSLSLLTSTLSRKAATSFLILLVVWVGSALIWPRVSVLFAARMVEVPAREIASLERSKLSMEVSQKNREAMGAIDLTGFEADPMARFSKFMDSLGQERQKQLDELTERFRLDREARLREQERIAISAARLSPAVATSLSLQELAGTSVSLPNAFEKQSREYQEQFGSFLKEKTGLSGHGGRVVIRQIVNGQEQEKPEIDVSEIPKFQFDQSAVPKGINTVLISLVTLIIAAFAALGFSWRKFLTYDAR